MKRVYWDSCCFIDFLQGSERGEVLKGVVDKKDSGELEIVTSFDPVPGGAGAHAFEGRLVPIASAWMEREDDVPHRKRSRFECAVVQRRGFGHRCRAVGADKGQTPSAAWNSGI